MKPVTLLCALAGPAAVTAQSTVASSVPSNDVLDGYVSYSIEFSSFPDFAGMPTRVYPLPSPSSVLKPAQETTRTQTPTRTRSWKTLGTSLAPSHTSALAATPRTMPSTTPLSLTPSRALSTPPIRPTTQQPSPSGRPSSSPTTRGKTSNLPMASTWVSAEASRAGGRPCWTRFPWPARLSAAGSCITGPTGTSQTCIPPRPRDP